MKSNICKELYESWEEKCNDVWNSTIVNVCSDECKNATYDLLNDYYGSKFKSCDCGLHATDFLDSPKKQEEMAMIGECYTRQSKMREVCEFNDAGQCQQCAANKGISII